MNLSLVNSFNPYHKRVDDEALGKSIVFNAHLNNSDIQRNEQERALLDEKISKFHFVKSKEQAALEKDLKTAYFANASGSKITAVALSATSLIALEKLGGVYERKDGSFLLDAKAGEIVRGWYLDIAYKQNYLKADVNEDGVIDDNEKLNLKSVFTPSKLVLCYDKPQMRVYGIRMYKELSSLSETLREKYKDFFTQETLNLALDKFIKQDNTFNQEGFDGKLDYKEFDKNTLHNFFRDLMQETLDKDPLLGIEPDKFLEALEKFKQKIKEEFKENAEKNQKLLTQDEDKEKIKAKLLEKGFENLSTEEKLLAQKYFPSLAENSNDKILIFKTELDLEEQNFLDLKV